MKAYLRTLPLWKSLFRAVITLASVFLLFQFITLYLGWQKQIIVGGVTIFIAVMLSKRNDSQVMTIALILLSLAATFRYGWWRVGLIIQYFSDQSNNRFTVNALLILMLIAAEMYTTLIMLLGYMQTLAPLQRKPIPLPSNEDLWPHVDVLIPTYNEPLSLVRYTALAAINIDYPPEKLHVYILDDGTRDEFRDFCEEAGIGYVVREKHNHAKAGNINHALTKMDAQLVAIFDCDHVPTRSFLQVTAGWFLADKKLAMLQTPHFFYSPDPFERNLLQYKAVPNEGELFYGVIQDGNDLWNATFFCGSCAVIRRTALDEVGGIAVETVTEDAHTSLRMQKAGWNTAYINIPQAAGLATETLSAHVGQRVRWARGMIQIFRTDNPMLAKGMKLSQRLCYFNAMLHFLYALPRLIFLCAPLAYMIFGLTIIPGYWVAILAYALPHLVISGATNSRLQGRHRHSFWNEIYETVLAPYILMPTLLALINPKLGTFNVTDKGSTLAETRFDRRIAAPTTWLICINVAAIFMAPYRLSVTDPHHPGTVICNLLWIFFNLVILGVAGAVANERQQRRTSVRVPAQIPVRMETSDGRKIEGLTVDMSVGGASVHCEAAQQILPRDVIRVAFPHQTGDATIGANVVGVGPTEVRLQFSMPSIEEQETLTRAIYSRADSWMNSREQYEMDRPLVSLARVFKLSFVGFHQVLYGLLTPKPKKAKSLKTKTAVVTLLLSLGLIHAKAQIPGAVSAPPAATTAPATVPATAATADAAPVIPTITADQADYKISLKDMGQTSGVDLHGPKSYSTYGFVLPYDRVARHAALELTYRFNPQLVPGTATIKVSINGLHVGDIAVPAQPQRTGSFAFVSFPVPAEFLIRNNNVSFEFTGGGALSMSGATRPVLAQIGASSRLLIASDQIPIKTDLGLLPLPLFDPEMQTTTTIPFVFLSPPNTKTLQAASIVASWFGILTTSRPIHFTTVIGHVPAGNVVIFSNGDRAKLPGGVTIPASGGSLNLVPNPTDNNGAALLLAGDNDDQLVTVARSLALMKMSHPKPGGTAPLLGNSVSIADFELPAARKPDDAPRWLTTEKLTPISGTASQDALTTDGSSPVPMYFRVPPDLYYGETQNLNLVLNYRYNARPLADKSALRVFLNGAMITEAPMAPEPGFAERQRTVFVPTANLRPFGNTFLYHFDFIPVHPNYDNRSADEKLQGAILQSSFLDIRGLDHWAAMPNLELFANAGFPFTRKADLADTTVVMPAQPTAGEITLLLYLMAHCGVQTGYPVLRVEIAGPDPDISNDRDYLMLGTPQDQPAFGWLDAVLPVTFDAGGVHVKEVASYTSQLQNVWQRFWLKLTRKPPAEMPSNNAGAPDMLIEGVQSPSFATRSVVILSMKDDSVVDEFADVFLERSQSSDISHTASLLRGGKFFSYAVETAQYNVGNISQYALMRVWFARHFWILLIAVSLISLVVARWVRDYLGWVAAMRLRAEIPV